VDQEKENKRVVEDFNAELARFFSTGDPAALAGFMAPDAVLRMPGMPPDVDGLMAALPMLQAGLSDFQMEISNLVAEGDLVAYQVTWTAVHSGDFMGIAPTGTSVTVTETHLDRIRDGQIVEHSGDWDRLGLMEQLGAIPAPTG
jgi:predicted ester cyclase